MRVTVDVAGEGVRKIDLPADATYADLVRAVDQSPQAVSVLVDGTPVPEDAPVKADEVTVLRMIRGGCG